MNPVLTRCRYQAYALARLMLDRDLRVNARLNRQRAVVVDVDETVLDNGSTGCAGDQSTRSASATAAFCVCGDNLADFSNVFEGKTTEERAAAVDPARQKFGARFIVLPNPMYGDWENAIYGYDSRLSELPSAQ